MTLESVALPSGGERTTVLGFGCSALIGGHTRTESLRLLAAAFDAGVRHFDVARSYGTGDAELVLGRFAGPRRDEITIATKFGIEPRPNTPSVAAAKALIRPVMRRSKSLLRVVRRHARHTVIRGAFSPEDARTSLGRSLEQLDTPFVDVLLLHDCNVSDWLNDSLREALDSLVESGRVRCYGTATGSLDTMTILRSDGPRPLVAQFDADAVDLNAERIAPWLGDSVPITYSCLSRALPSIRAHIARDPGLAAEWSRALDLDARSSEELASLLLCCAVRTNERGITLFSSGDPDRITRNVLAVSERRYEDDQLRAFARLVRVLAQAQTAHDRLGAPSRNNIPGSGRVGTR